MPDPTTLLDSWLERHADAPAVAWLDERCQRLAAGAPAREAIIAFGLAVRKVGKTDLNLSVDDLDAAAESRAGWRPEFWSLDQVARARLLLALPADDSDTWRGLLDRLFQAADVHEALALYRALPLLPHPELLVERAREGLRSNMVAVFRAVAHYNPYPAEYLPLDAWNQLVLKALFVAVDLAPIAGLDLRANPELAQMLVDYANERWAAQRTFNPELWRCVGPCAVSDEHLAALARALADPLQADAAALALAASPHPAAADTLATRPDLAAAIEQGTLTWSALGAAKET